MLNKNNERELAYVAQITKVLPIEGADNIELVFINDGWTCIAKKNEFNKDDLCVYFEIDSKLPSDKEWAAFMEAKHYKVKTMKLGKFKVISQGLALPASAFGWELEKDYIKNGDNKYKKGDFLTETLGITYSVEEDNARKSNNPSSGDKYKKMASRHPKLFQNPFIKFLYKRKWGKKLLFIFFGKKNDKGRSWPYWVKKTDEERVENMAWILQDKTTHWVATEKVDGTSTTFSYRKLDKPFTKPEFFVCSRNVVFDKPDKKCFYDSNVYREMANKYDIENVIAQIFEDYKKEYSNLEAVTLQGETYGEGIQKRGYIKDHDLAAFNLIFVFSDDTKIRFNPIQMTEILSKYNIPCVPIINEDYILPDTIDELRAYVNSEKSKIDGGMKEGIVFRDLNGEKSFKCVSPEFLLKYHQ